MPSGIRRRIRSPGVSVLTRHWTCSRHRSDSDCVGCWATADCSVIHGLTGIRTPAEFVCETNNWLLPMQQLDGVTADVRGQFFNLNHPDFGPPHAASTGAKMVGLADAALLAHSVGDSAVSSNIQLCLRHGLRWQRQLQFRDGRDMFYVPRRSRVQRALRTEINGNSVTVVSATNTLPAATKILRMEG